MINYDKFTLDNGLTVLVHQDKSTPVIAMNILYAVGARDEHPEKTGFAHLFEHLMFGGSKNAPKYDIPLERTGGENNAFTNNDFTNYYLTIPRENLETAFWLESDRMLQLDISESSLEVQRNVVIEEFKQRYLNQPYGDAWLKLRPLAFKVHPYRWSTIGREISHIEQANIEDVRSFYEKYYKPNNAIMVLSGDVELENIKLLSEKWFGGIPSGKKIIRELPAEPLQNEKRFEKIIADVPYDALYIAWHMDSRLGPDYHTTDLISDILSNGESSRLYQRLIKEQGLFSEINAFISGDTDPGLFIITGKLIDGISHEQAEEAIFAEIKKIKTEHCAPEELEKVQNKIEASQEFSEMSALNKAMNLAFFEFLGDAAMINQEIAKYKQVRASDIKRVAEKIFQTENTSLIRYKRK